MLKMKLLSFIVLFVSSPVYSTVQSKMSRAPLADECMYFKAEKEGRVLYFVPSHHTTPLSDLPQPLQDDFKTYDRVIVECCRSIDVPEGEETPEINPLEPYSFLLSEEALREVGGYRDESDVWQIHNQNLHADFEAVFLGLGKQLPHLADYKRLKPAVALAIFGALGNFREHQGGMDNGVVKIITTAHPQIPGSVETQQDVLNSLRVFERSYESLSDDFERKTEVCSADLYSSTLCDRQRALERFPNTLLDEESLHIRNPAWVAQLNAWVPEGKTLFVFGQAHFPGRYGLIRLMQAEGWTWSHIFSGKEITPLEADMHFDDK